MVEDHSLTAAGKGGIQTERGRKDEIMLLYAWRSFQCFVSCGTAMVILCVPPIMIGLGNVAYGTILYLSDSRKRKWQTLQSV